MNLYTCIHMRILVSIYIHIIIGINIKKIYRCVCRYDMCIHIFHMYICIYIYVYI